MKKMFAFSRLTALLTGLCLTAVTVLLLSAPAQAQAQAIIDNAVNDANNIRQGSIQYTDEMLKSLQTIITHSMEGAQGRFDAFMNSMKSSYDIVSSNRQELSGSIVMETAEEEA